MSVGGIIGIAESAASTCARASGGAASIPRRTIGVSTTPGQTQFTRMFASAVQELQRPRESHDAVLRRGVNRVRRVRRQPRH